MIEDEILSPIAENASTIWSDEVKSNPSLSELRIEIDRLNKEKFDLIIAFGGGSTIDTGKVLAIALTEKLKKVDLREIIDDPSLHKKISSFPLYAVPTTSGTGSEVTPFATIWDHSKKKKLSLSGSAVFPYCAIVDPVLTHTMPEEETIATGLDAINQCVESIWNVNSTSITTQLAYKGLKIGFNALPKFIKSNNTVKTDELGLRADMSECSLISGLCISQTRTALCHSISYPLTAHYGIPHGLATAFTMCAVLKLNLKFDDGRLMDLKSELGSDNVEETFLKLNKKLRVNERIKKYMPNLKDSVELVDEMYTPDRANNNIAPVDIKTIREILKKSIS